MKKIFAILLFLICLTSCVATNSSSQMDEQTKTYVYEIHTIGGISDTLVVDSPARRWVSEGNIRVILEDVEYSYVDRFKLLEIK